MEAVCLDVERKGKPPQIVGLDRIKRIANKTDMVMV
jgi:hypothetical protein